MRARARTAICAGLTGLTMTATACSFMSLDGFSEPEGPADAAEGNEDSSSGTSGDSGDAGDASPTSDGEPPVCALASATSATFRVAETSGSGEFWLHPTRALSIDGNTANSAPPSRTLVVRDAWLAVPATARVVGIEVSIVRRGSPDGDLADEMVSLVTAGGVSQSRASPAPWMNVLAPQTYGAPDDTWGLTVLGADVTKAEFGVAMAVKRVSGTSNANAYVDGVTMTVHYCE
jgi:hypothetical protein